MVCHFPGHAYWNILQLVRIHGYRQCGFINTPFRQTVSAYTSGYNASFLSQKTEYEAYISYQDCLLRGEVVRINLPGDDGKEDSDSEGEGSDGYFKEEDWPDPRYDFDTDTDPV